MENQPSQGKEKNPKGEMKKSTCVNNVCKRRKCTGVKKELCDHITCTGMKTLILYIR